MKKLIAANWVLIAALAASTALAQPKVVGEPVLKEIDKRGGQVVISLTDPKSFCDA